MFFFATASPPVLSSPRASSLVWLQFWRAHVLLSSNRHSAGRGVSPRAATLPWNFSSLSAEQGFPVVVVVVVRAANNRTAILHLKRTPKMAACPAPGIRAVASSLRAVWRAAVMFLSSKFKVPLFAFSLFLPVRPCIEISLRRRSECG